jgi:hypothetical protein
VCSELLAQVAGLVNQQPLLELSRRTLVILKAKAENQKYLAKCINEAAVEATSQFNRERKNGEVRKNKA